MMKKTIPLILILMILPLSLWSLEPKGPLQGKNYYVPFLPFYSFPGLGAASGDPGGLNITLSQYYIQDIVTEFHLTGTELVKERFIDYEGYIFEPTISFVPIDGLEAGLATRLHAYYGGIFDGVFQWFHHLFGFPNGGRESYPQDEVYINIQTTSGFDLSLSEPTFALGDTDLYIKWTFLPLDYIDLALMGALKIPTGSMEQVTGSDYADLAFALLADFHFLDRFAFYMENGIIVPGQLLGGNDSHPLPIYHLLAGAEFMATSRLSFLVQFKLNTSPVDDGVTIPENITYTVKLVKPLTNLMFGARWDIKRFRFQFHIEEDTFTNNGADLIANFTIGTSFNLY